MVISWEQRSGWLISKCSHTNTLHTNAYISMNLIFTQYCKCMSLHNEPSLCLFIMVELKIGVFACVRMEFIRCTNKISQMKIMIYVQSPNITHTHTRARVRVLRTSIYKRETWYLLQHPRFLLINFIKQHFIYTQKKECYKKENQTTHIFYSWKCQFYFGVTYI